jgi:hypothetical protein
VKVGTDLEELRRYLSVPPGVASARFVVEAVAGAGDSFLPGPTDTRVYALLRPLVDGKEFEQAFGPSQGRQTILISHEAAAALFPDQELPAGDGDVALSGAGLDASRFGSSFYRAGAALRVGNAVLVSAFTT